MSKAVKGITTVTFKFVPLELYLRFKSRCVSRGVTVLEGFVEAMNLFLEKY